MLRLRATLVLLPLLAPAAACRAQSPPAAGPPRPAADSGSAAWVVERFFARDGWPDRARWYTGEMAELHGTTPTIGATLPPGVVVTHRALRADPARAVFATTGRDAAHTQDWYTYLVRDGGAWKLEAVRAFWIPALYAAAADSLAAAEPLPDSLAHLLATMRLTLASDSALRAHFAAHRDAFERLAAEFGASGRREVRGGTATALSRGVRDLSVAAVRRGEREAPGCTLFEIGGMLDNSVGYLHAPPGCAVPAMSPGRFILVDPIAPGWYLYKTT